MNNQDVKIKKAFELFNNKKLEESKLIFLDLINNPQFDKKIYYMLYEIYLQLNDNKNAKKYIISFKEKLNKKDFNFLFYSSFDQNGYETSIDVSSQLNQKLITGLIFGYEVFNETINYQKGIDLKTYSITNNYNRVFLSIYLGLLYN